MVTKDFWLNDLIHINHPLADHISVQNSPMHHAGENTSELAFFRGDVFQTEIIEEFAEYSSDAAGETRVYDWVPNEKIESFLEVYKA